MKNSRPFHFRHGSFDMISGFQIDEQKGISQRAWAGGQDPV
jgi:hypothetical protein